MVDRKSQGKRNIENACVMGNTVPIYGGVAHLSLSVFFVLFVRFTTNSPQQVAASQAKIAS